MTPMRVAAVVAVAVVLLVVGLAIESTPLALVGFFGGVVVLAVQGLAVGGDWIRDVSAGRFRRDGRG